MLRIVPLGGLGEIGLNAMVFETESEAFLVDCGILFPKGPDLGVDVILPDFTYLHRIADKLRGVVLTHGHEDHLGALPHLLRELPLPVWGAPFTLGLLRRKLEEAGLPRLDLHELLPGKSAAVGTDFEVEGIRMTHSVPDALGLAIHTDEGVVVHSGDFKLDPTPVAGLPTDLARLGALGGEGVLALLSDSTNSHRPGTTRSEREVGLALEPLIADAKGRVVVATFASNIHRIQQIVDASVRHGRKVAVLGRSLEQNVALALSMGLLEGRSAFISVEGVQKRRRDEVTILAAGAQGEPRSALARLAGADPSLPFSLLEGDLVILSATAIPGNEVAVAAVLDDLARRGVEAVHGERVHASGHASQQEQRKLIETVAPRHFLPVHGEFRHLLRHLRTAQEVGVPEERTHLITNGQVLALEGGEATSGDEVPTGRVPLDRHGGSPLSAGTLQERALLGELGVITAVVGIDRHTGALRLGPKLVSRGVQSPSDGALDASVRGEVQRALEALPRRERLEIPTVEEAVRLAVRRAHRRATDKKPWVIPLVLTIGEEEEDAFV
jgi:ribonuclease J